MAYLFGFSWVFITLWYFIFNTFVQCAVNLIRPAAFHSFQMDPLQNCGTLESKYRRNSIKFLNIDVKHFLYANIWREKTVCTGISGTWELKLHRKLQVSVEKSCKNLSNCFTICSLAIKLSMLKTCIIWTLRSITLNQSVQSPPTQLDERSFITANEHEKIITITIFVFEWFSMNATK